MYCPASLWLLGLVQLGNAAVLSVTSSDAKTTPTLKDHGILAIIPTTSGQIGINPVESDLGDPATYIGDIYGTDTQYITVSDPDTTTKWIGVNTEYLSMDGTSTVEVVIATATAAANGQNIGDISVILPEGLAVALKKSVNNAISSCGALKLRKRNIDEKIVRRQTDEGNSIQSPSCEGFYVNDLLALSCIFELARTDAEAGGIFDSYITNDQLAAAGIKIAANAQAWLRTAIATIASPTTIANIALWMAAFDAFLSLSLNDVISGTSGDTGAIGKINIPAAGVGAPPASKGCTGNEPIDEDSLLCRESICQGEATGLCTEDPYVNCPCIATIPSSPGLQTLNITWLDLQQQWLQDIINGVGGIGTPDSQQVALASYINPLADPAVWDRMIGYPVDKVSILVANVINGPGADVDTNWQDVINRAHNSGRRILGYVRTGYLGIDVDLWYKYEPFSFVPSLLSCYLPLHLKAVVAHSFIFRLYPGKIGGIFFDEGWNDCGDNNQYAELYRLITKNTKRKYPGAFTVLNPGAPMPQCFEHSADTLMTFESSYEAYTSPDYTPNPWTASDSRKIWHIIFNVPIDKVSEVVALSLNRGASFLHITDDNLPNPYDTIPDVDYMQTLINSVSGGEPAISDPLPFPNDGSPASQPTGLTITAFDYSSVSLSWSSGSGTMTHTTIANRDPGSSGLTFEVYGIGGDGSLSSASNSVTANTPELPDGQTIANVQMISSTATTTTYQADILIPYAFLRVFITDPDLSCSLPGWPLGYSSGYHVCSQYMVEAETLYTYSGANLTDPNANWPWSWAQEGDWANVQVTQNMYTY
ncbi:Spherulation-specific family 4-domain-containing protein [Xylogone sp. PMI_703]|nr:Spherulation-specific family 4-domain-containing protein [Xylogone sp. PMI_703]